VVVGERIGGGAHTSIAQNRICPTLLFGSIDSYTDKLSNHVVYELTGATFFVYNKKQAFDQQAYCNGIFKQCSDSIGTLHLSIGNV
jgi:hypothetical protein